MKKYLTKEQTDKIFSVNTSNGCREMGEDRFHQAVNEAINFSNQVQAEVKPDACGKWSFKKPDKPCLMVCEYYMDNKYYKVKEINFINNNLVVIDKDETDITWVNHEEFEADEYYIIEWL